MTFDYKKYSLERLEEWMHDAMSAGEASPQEIYDVIVGVVKDNYYTYKQQASQAYELLALLNGGVDSNKYQNHLNKILSCDKDDPSEECKKSWTSFWEDDMPPWGHSDLEALSNYYPHPDQPVYTEEELNSMCDAAAEEEKEKCREYNLREAEYYNKRAELDSEVEAIKAEGGYEWTPACDSKSKEYWEIDRNKTYEQMIADGFIMTDDGFWIKDDKKKWVLPVEVDDPSGEFFITFPDSLLKEANLKEGDEVEWVDKGDGSFVFRKISKPLEMNKC